jgi:hypothetical protein
MLPWLLAALAVAIGGAFLLWRNRSREAYAGGPQVDAFVAPEPAPAPRAAPPRPAPAGEVVDPSSLGLVSTRLRPWIEIGFHPTRCILEGQRVVVDFELELFNSGSAPARGVLVEASLFNAGPTQDQQIGSFFATLVGCFFGTATGWSAARVTVPLRVKFWSALGPIASAAGVLVELLLCDGTSWASAVSGLSASAPASNAIPKRETALICSRYAR